ncbi:DegV family protein [Clostridium sp. SYSU_GA19001]|uniref:DegV family protein n=1 Tax=Clostridium caldaquaticum TaxID=2940653 RepID=UPI0020773D26|nr:DegV family protein [Clostridium caldaquaticum]MCM8710213.1 DegV family protein [Clostridium caldaquaticum]
MAIKIVADSSCDLTDEMKKEMNVDIAPLTLQLGDKSFIDDESLDVKHYVKEMGECEVAPKTACPSPDDYMKRYEGPESVFVVTLSNHLSGSYNSAVLAKNMFLEEVENKFIHVFDSLSASAGETVIVMKINELAKLNISEAEIVKKVTKFIKEMKTFFILENLEHLAKAGRLNPVVAKVASMLSIKPIMAGDEGTIKLFEKVRGYKKALRRLVDIIGEEGTNLQEKVLGIAHCNCLERALEFKEEVLKKYNFKDIVVVEMAGLSSTYADDGGIVIAF